jgi:hypothetical protein
VRFFSREFARLISAGTQTYWLWLVCPYFLISYYARSIFTSAARFAGKVEFTPAKYAVATQPAARGVLLFLQKRGKCKEAEKVLTDN